MSGHSKWHKIKHKKAVTDSKKSQLFGRLSREISVLARRNSDPSANPALREAIERAKRANVPQENIDRLLSKEADTANTVVYEGYGPGGTAIMVTAMTDNTNRTVAELRSIFKKYGCSLGSPNSVRWKFTQQARIATEISPQTNMEDLELKIIDGGAADFVIKGNQLTIIGPVSSRENIEDIIADADLPINESEIEYFVPPEQRVSISPEQENQLELLTNELLDHPDVDTVHTDINY